MPTRLTSSALQHEDELDQVQAVRQALFGRHSTLTCRLRCLCDAGLFRTVPQGSAFIVATGEGADSDRATDGFVSLDMLVCCLASLVFLFFPLLLWGKGSVERKTKIGCHVCGASLVISEPGRRPAKTSFYHFL